MECTPSPSIFSLIEGLSPSFQASICAIETKYFIPSGNIDWFNNLIPALDSFEEANMANISPTVKIDISIKLGMIEEITIGTACSPKELMAYKSFFQEYRDICALSYTEILGLDPSIIKHHIDTWPYFFPVRQKQPPSPIQIYSYER
jgi:hypothetical protein